MRDCDQTHERVFGMAAELGREEELFGMTKEQKREADTFRRYYEALDEAELLGAEADVAPEDFFVSLSDLSTFFSVKLLHCLLRHGCRLGTSKGTLQYKKNQKKRLLTGIKNITKG